MSRSADKITVLDVVDAIEGQKPLFECQEVRKRCAIFGRVAPTWSTRGVCGVHSVMLRAEKSMRAELAKTALADLAQIVSQKAPADFSNEVRDWLQDRVELRSKARSGIS